MDTSSGHNQEMSSDSVGNMLVVGPKASAGGGTQQQASNPQDRKPRPHPEQAQKCPRCDSANTKFCYYNNYSLTQPRYFCKACRRYWTKGGTLRNVPVGGGCRKNRRSSSSSSTSSSSSAALASKSRVGPQEHHHNPLIHPALLGPTGGGSHGFPLPPLLGGGAGCYDQNDLTLAFARLQKSGAEQLGFDGLSILGNNINASSGHNDLLGLNSASSGAFLEALRSGFLESSASQNSSAAGNSVTSGFQNLYYGFCNNGNSNNIGDVSENSTPTTTVGVSGVSDHHHHMGMANYDHDDDHDHVSNATTTAVTVTTIKQELSHGNGMRGGYNDHDQHDHQNSRMLWGIPNWQLSGSDHHGIGSGNLSEFDGSASTGRESWNGFASSWHGLLNTTPLM